MTMKIIPRAIKEIILRTPKVLRSRCFVPYPKQLCILLFAAGIASICSAWISEYFYMLIRILPEADGGVV